MIRNYPVHPVVTITIAAAVTVRDLRGRAVVLVLPDPEAVPVPLVQWDLRAPRVNPDFKATQVLSDLLEPLALPDLSELPEPLALPDLPDRPTVAEMADISPICSIMAATAMGAMTRMEVRSNLAKTKGCSPTSSAAAMPEKSTWLVANATT